MKATLDYDISKEKKFSYKNLSSQEIIHHLALFISDLWQIHAFSEGNTRTSAVFFIKYLRTLGYNVTNDIFAENSWYFRNALVRANYTDLKNNVHSTYDKYGNTQYFGRSDIIKIINIKPAMASRLINLLLTNQIIKPIQGKGKGKYQFYI